jgi:maltose/moltooligosaccharide transporter
MPYAMLAGALPANKMGFYMGVFNFFVVIPQIVAAAILGFFVRDLFNGESIYALVVGGISMVIAGILNFVVKDRTEETANETIDDIMITEKTPTTYS